MMSPTINTSSIKPASNNEMTNMAYSLPPSQRKTSDSASELSTAESSSSLSYSTTESGAGAERGHGKLGASAAHDRETNAGAKDGRKAGVSGGRTPTYTKRGGVAAEEKKSGEGEGEAEEEEKEEIHESARLVHLPAVVRRKSSTRRASKGSVEELTNALPGKGSTLFDDVLEDLRLKAESQLFDLQDSAQQRRQEQERPTFPHAASFSIPTATTPLDYLLRMHSPCGSETNSKRGSRTEVSKNPNILSNSDLHPSQLNLDLTSNTSFLSGPFSVGSNISDYLSKYNSGSDLGTDSEKNVANVSSYQAAYAGVMARNESLSSNKSSADTLPARSDQRLEQLPDKDANKKRQNGRRQDLHDDKSVGYQFFHVEPCLYTHRMFVRAAKIFEVLKSKDTETLEARATRRRQGAMVADEKPTIPDMDFKNAHEQIKTFELTFATLKYQELFRDILERTGFFTEFSNLRSDYSLVCIILYDLQSRKFQRRVPLQEELAGVTQSALDIFAKANTANSSVLSSTTSSNTYVARHYYSSMMVDNKPVTKGFVKGTGFLERPSMENNAVYNNDVRSLDNTTDSDVALNGHGEVIISDPMPPTPATPPPTYAERAVGQLDAVCLEIEDALLSRKTKLQSCLAKERIRRNAPTLEHLLPESVRNKDETKCSTPVYCWVNQIKASMENMISSIEAEGFQELKTSADISEQTTKVYRRDKHCSDLLVFPPQFNMYFKDSHWVRDGKLVQQDKSSCLAPQTIQHILGMDQDIIHVNIGTGITTAHIASLIKGKSMHTHIWAFGPEDPAKVKKAVKNLEYLGVKNTKIIHEKFLKSDPEDPKYKNVRVVLVTANCSKSAITSPVQFIVSEGEDMQILGELSQADSNISRVTELSYEHDALLKHALKFPRVRAVVYTTRSRYEAENEQLVNQALNDVNALGPQLGRRVPFKVTPPVLPFSGEEIGSDNGVVDGKFACFKPTDKSNGCFIAIIAREPEDPKEVAKSAVARARNKGMLGKGDSEVTTPKSGTSLDKLAPTNGKGGKAKLIGGMKLKLTNHKNATAIGARLYQAGLLNRIEQPKSRSSNKPEHMKVIKHPAPFRLV